MVSCVWVGCQRQIVTATVCHCVRDTELCQHPSCPTKAWCGPINRQRWWQLTVDSELTMHEVIAMWTINWTFAALNCVGLSYISWAAKWKSLKEQLQAMKFSSSFWIISDLLSSPKWLMVTILFGKVLIFWEISDFRKLSQHLEIYDFIIKWTEKNSVACWASLGLHPISNFSFFNL